MTEEKQITDNPTGGNTGNVFAIGQPNEAHREYFTGKSYLNALIVPDKSNTINVTNVTFEPSCINHWHKHTTEQILLVIEGIGWYQEWGKPAQLLQKGDVVVVPIGVKHWHGATAQSWFAHLAIMDVQKAKTEWKEPVSQKDYDKLGANYTDN